MAAFGFKLPSIVPQDLQLIHELVAEAELPPSKPTPATARTMHADDEIASSDSDTDSEGEVEANILAVDDDGASDTTVVPAPTAPESSDDNSLDSSSDSESEDEQRGRQGKAPAAEDTDLDQDEDAEPSTPADALLKTKNEVLEVEITISPIEEVGPHEELERVGEVMSIVDSVVIIKGSASEIAHRASERALDSDTLLVFEDRKVLGYIYETFGPTNQPLYQVRFNQKYPLDKEKVQLSRAVFHVPQRSNFVFVRQLKQYKGSDASNVHDEEPAEDEIEFSDDEAEAAHKRAMAQRRGRSHSLTGSRHATPTPAQMRDQDMVDEPYSPTDPYVTRSAYNDLDFGAGPSRPAPMAYDDPYSDSYGVDAAPMESRPDVESSRSTVDTRADDIPETGNLYGERDQGRGRGRARGRGRGRDMGRGRGRERGRGRGRGRGNWGGGEHDRRQDGYSQDQPRSLSPTSLAIARATGQFADGSPMSAGGTGAESGYYPQYAASPQQQFDFGYGYAGQYAPVQPHINPRFASQFAMGFAQQAQFPPSYDSGYGYSGPVGVYGDATRGGRRASGSWADQWAVGGGHPPQGESSS